MKRMMVAAIAAGMLAFAACDDDMTTNPTTSTLKLAFTGLEDLGANAQYEGWIMVNGAPKSTGTFTVDGSGNLSKSEFSVASGDVSAATGFILTIEPKPDPDPAPSDVHILAGDFAANSANLTVGHQSALGNTFASASGKFILATPTDGAMNTNENSGIWFLELVNEMPMVGLSLPMLPAGWKYEGWAVINGTPVTTGTFTAVNMADQSAPFSGATPGPPFPGEDFLMNAPAGLTFPTNLSGGMAVITIEPSPDNSPMPFTLKPLTGSIPAGAGDHVVYTMGANTASFPTGTATR
jgi:hypothetical protein